MGKRASCWAGLCVLSWLSARVRQLGSARSVRSQHGGVRTAGALSGHQRCNLRLQPISFAQVKQRTSLGRKRPLPPCTTSPLMSATAAPLHHEQAGRLSASPSSLLSVAPGQNSAPANSARASGRASTGQSTLKVWSWKRRNQQQSMPALVSKRGNDLLSETICNQRASMSPRAWCMSASGTYTELRQLGR